ncbi:MAG: cyclase family protein [Actinomycetota bacterium]
MCLPGTVEKVAERARTEGFSRRSFIASAGAAGAAGVTATLLPAPAEARGKGRNHRKRAVDLTHTFSAGFPMYIGDEPSRSTLTTIPANGFYGQAWAFGEHSCTHMDAPGHFVDGGRLTPEIALNELMLRVAVIDISKKAGRDPDAQVTPEDLEAYERRHGRIPRNSAVFMDSGWAKKLPDEDAYKNADSSGTYHFPGFGIEAIEWLLDRRSVRAIGVDTLSLDPGNSTTFATHVTWLGADRFGIENLANLGRLRRRGATAFIGVIPWEEGSGGPCRVIAYS